MTRDDFESQLSALRAERDRLAKERDDAEQKARIYKAVLDGPVEASAAQHYRRTGDDPVSYAGFCRERKRADAAESALSEARREARERLDLLVQCWWQWAYRIDGHPTWAMDGGLSTLEDLAETLVKAGKLEPVAEHPEKDWYRAALSVGSAAGGDRT